MNSKMDDLAMKVGMGEQGEVIEDSFEPEDNFDLDNQGDFVLESSESKESETEEESEESPEEDIKAEPESNVKLDEPNLDKEDIPLNIFEDEQLQDRFREINEFNIN